MADEFVYEDNSWNFLLICWMYFKDTFVIEYNWNAHIIQINVSKLKESTFAILCVIESSLVHTLSSKIHISVDLKML